MANNEVLNEKLNDLLNKLEDAISVKEWTLFAMPLPRPPEEMRKKLEFNLNQQVKEARDAVFNFCNL